MHAVVRYTVCVNVLRESGEYELAAGCRRDMALLSVQYLKKKKKDASAPSAGSVYDTLP